MTEVIASGLAAAAAALAGSGLFGALGGRLQDAILAKAKSLELTAGEVLFRQGEPGDCAYVVVDGELEVVVDIGIGEVQMAVLGAHQLVGEIAVFGSLPRTATVVARCPVRLLRLDREDVMGIIAETPDAGVAIITDLGQRLSKVNQPLAFLSMAAQALKQDQFDTNALGELTRAAKHLGPFAKSFEEMIREVEAKQIRRQEMAMAARIQLSVLPKPRVDGTGAGAPFGLEAFMRPTREVGGDLYDYFMIDEGHLAFVVADVSGKSVPASLFMVMFRTVVRAVAVPGMGAEQVLERANTILGEDNDACMFVTVFFGVLDIETGGVCYVNAGHNPPYLLPASGGRRTLEANGAAVGMVESPHYQTKSVALAPGDVLFVFTDGITEAFAPNGQQFGEIRLEALLDDRRGWSPAALVNTVVAAVDAFAAGHEQSDDITCLALIYRPNRLVG